MARFNMKDTLRNILEKVETGKHQDNNNNKFQRRSLHDGRASSNPTGHQSPFTRTSPGAPSHEEAMEGVATASQTLPHRTSPGQRGLPLATPKVPRECICFRAHTNVACCSCGLLIGGRVRIQCPVHPNTIHLMDVERCPECYSVTLTELRTT